MFFVFRFCSGKIIFSLRINNKNDSKRQQTLTVDYKRLLSALFLTNAFTLQRQTQRKAMETNLPEYIEGIPTEKSESRKRREIIKNEYINLIGNLQKKRGKKAVFNDFLQADVYIIMRESEKKASNSAAFNWQSTYAVRHLETIIKEAVPQEGKPIYSTPKASGKQKEFNYVNMATLYYAFKSSQQEFLNFTIKLVMGIKSDGRHVQYSVNKVELI